MKKTGGKQLGRLFLSLMFHSFLFSVQGLRRMHGKNFLMLSFGLFYPPYTLHPRFFLILYSSSFWLPFLSFSFNELLFFLYLHFFADSSPFRCLLLNLFFLFPISVRRHYSENVGCSFSMYEVFSITLNLWNQFLKQCKSKKNKLFITME